MKWGYQQNLQLYFFSFMLFFSEFAESFSYPWLSSQMIDRYGSLFISSARCIRSSQHCSLTGLSAASCPICFLVQDFWYLSAVPFTDDRVMAAR